MIRIDIQNISKRYQYHWVLKELSYTFEPNKTYGLSGQNGSGKSTFLKIIAGFTSYTKGLIEYQIENQDIKRDEIYKYTSIAAPYIDLDEEFTPSELFKHYSKFKDFDISLQDFELLLDFKDKDKIIKHFSSGMKQKVQLCMALCNNSPLLLLDEPTSYLDIDNQSWFNSLLSKKIGKKTIVIASNDSLDFQFCDSIFTLE